MPLKEISIETKILQNLASNKIILKYENPSDSAVNVNFKFPVDVDSAIYNISAKYNENTEFYAVVKEKQQAIKEFEQAIENGDEVVLATQDENQNDIISLKLGSLQANSVAEVTVFLSQEVQLYKDKFGANIYRFKLATSYFNRYGNVQPKDFCDGDICIDKFTTPVDPFLKSVKPDFNFVADVNNAEITTVQPNVFSFSRSSVSCKNSATCKKVFKKDEDIEISFRIPDSNAKAIYVEDETAMVTNYIPVSETNNVGKPFDYTLIIDNSGSMFGSRIYNAKKSLEQIVNSLPTNSVFNIIKFGSNYEALYLDSQTYTDESKAEALSYIQAMDADMGGTEMLNAINFAIEAHKRDDKEKYPIMQMFVITDGAISNQEQVFELIRTNAGNTGQSIRVMSVGIGSGSSSSLVKGLAANGNGYASFISEDLDFTPEKSLTESVLKALVASTTSFVHNITFNDINADFISVSEITSGQNFNFYVPKEALLSPPMKMRWKENSVQKNGLVTSEFEADFSDVTSVETENFLHKNALTSIACKRKIQKLYKNYHNRRDTDVKNEIIDLSVTCNILTPVTALIGVNYVDGEKAEETFDLTLESTSYEYEVDMMAMPSTNYNYRVLDFILDAIQWTTIIDFG